MRRPTWLAASVLLVVVGLSAGLVLAGEDVAADVGAEQGGELAGDTDGAGEGKSVSLWQVIKWGGMIEWIIILCSLVAMTLIIEHFINIRFGKAIPDELVATVSGMMQNRQYSEVLALCRAQPCFFGDVVAAGLQKLRHDFSAVQEVVADTIDRQGIALHAKISYLSFIASTCPMLGLLGTVCGMIRAFNKIAYHQGLGRPKLLAEGVSQALITTATGLVVAIPVLAFFFFFRERVNRIILEVETVAADLFEVFRPTRRIAEDNRS